MMLAHDNLKIPIIATIENNDARRGQLNEHMMAYNIIYFRKAALKAYLNYEDVDENTYNHHYLSI